MKKFALFLLLLVITTTPICVTQAHYDDYYNYCYEEISEDTLASNHLWNFYFSTRKLDTRQRQRYEQLQRQLASECEEKLRRMRYLLDQLSNRNYQDLLDDMIKALISGFVASKGSMKTAALVALATLISEVSVDMWKKYNAYNEFQQLHCELNMYFNQYRVVSDILENDR